MSSTRLSPSSIFTAAANVPEVTSIVATEDGICAMCGVTVSAGERTNPGSAEVFGESFNNKLQLAGRASPGTPKYVCGHCMALWRKEFLQNYSKSYACAEGLFKLASNDDIIALLRSPPTTPYVAISSTTQQQHLIWRAPVNVSPSVIYIQYGDEVLTIRRHVLNRALADWSDMLAIMRSAGIKSVMPYLIDRELAHSHNGELRRDVATLLAERSRTDIAARMARLSAGEWWALSVARQYIGLSTPERTRIQVAL